MNSKIFCYREEGKYKRIYLFNLKLFKLKRIFSISNKELNEIVANIKSFSKNITPTNQTISPKVNDIVLAELKKLNKFYFLSNKGNLGDAIIANSELQIFNCYTHELNKFNYRFTTFDKPFNFVYGGGGIFVDLYSKECDRIFKLFKNKNLKKCVILPSSFYNIQELIKILDERFVVFCREKYSYDYLVKSNTKAKIYLSDDMFFSTDINFYYQNNSLNSNQLENLKRNIDNYSIDDLKKILNEYFMSYCVIYNKVKQILSKIKQDKIKIAFLLRQDNERKVNSINFKDNNLDLSICGGIGDKSCLDNAYVQLISELFFSAIDCADVIVTDRLHIGTTAALLNKEVFLFDNNYGKVSGVYEQSMKSMTNVHLLKSDDLENIYDIIDSYKIKSTSDSSKLLKLELNAEQFLTRYLAYKTN